MTLSRKTLQPLIGFGVSLILIAVMIWMVEWAAVVRELRRVNYLWFIPVTVLTLTHLWIRAIRWKVLLPKETNLSTRVLFEIMMVGNLATYVLPMRAGEFVRPFLLARRTPVSFSSSFVTVVIERFFDLITVLFTFMGIVIYLPNMPQWVFKGALILGVVAAAIFVVILLSSYAPQLVQRIVELCLKAAPKMLHTPLLNFSSDFVKGAGVLAAPRTLIAMTLLTVVVWATSYGIYYLFLPMLNLDFSILLALTISVVLALAVAAPSMPGFIGVYQAGCLAAFSLFGTPTEIAVAYAIVTHIFQYLLILLVGGYVVIRDNLKIGELSKQATTTQR